MSHLALSTHDVLAALAPAARKTRDASDDTAAGFADALAQSEEETAASTSATPRDPASGSAASATTASESDSADLWKGFLALVGGDAAPATASQSLVGLTPADRLSRQIAAARVDATASETATATDTAPTVATPAAAASSKALASAAALARSSLPALNWPRAGQGAASIPTGNLSAKTTGAAQAAAAQSPSSATQTGTTEAAPTPTPAPAVAPNALAPTSPAADPSAALLAAAAPLQTPAPQASPSVAASQPSALSSDDVARIGAALSSLAVPAAPVKTFHAADEAPSLPEEGGATPVHVVSQQTYLPPVSAGFGDGRNHQAQAPEMPAASEPKKSRGDETTSASASKAEPAAPAPQAAAAAVTAAAANVGAPGGLVAGAPRSTVAASVVATSANAAAAEPAATAQAAAPRRDLEITIQPKELGGMSVRMTASGDRLEIAFVADRGETARLLSDKSGALESQLTQAGLGLGGLDISAETRETAFAGGQAAGGQTQTDSGATPQRQQTFPRDAQDQNRETGDGAGNGSAASGDRGLYL